MKLIGLERLGLSNNKSAVDIVGETCTEAGCLNVGSVGCLVNEDREVEQDLGDVNGTGCYEFTYPTKNLQGLSHGRLNPDGSVNKGGEI